MKIGTELKMTVNTLGHAKWSYCLEDSEKQVRKMKIGTELKMNNLGRENRTTVQKTVNNNRQGKSELHILQMTLNNKRKGKLDDSEQIKARNQNYSKQMTVNNNRQRNIRTIQQM